MSKFFHLLCRIQNLEEGEKPLRIRFDNVCGHIEKDGGDSLSLMSLHKKYEQIFENISYLIQQKSNIWDIYNYGSTKITIDSYYDLLVENILNCDNIY